MPAPFEGVDETGILPQTGFPKQIKLFMLDTRYDAGDPKTGGERLFRPEKWIETMSAIRAHDGLSIVCTGRPLTEPSGLWHEQSWLNFAELPAFLQLCREKKNIIVLSGDIHKNLKLVHDNTYEFYSSAAAQTGEENFGLLDLDADVIRASLYKKTSAGKRARRHIEEIIPTADIGTARFGV